MKCDCTILVSSCDAYKDILDPFFELLHRFWPNLEYPIFLSTESLEYKNKNFEIKNIHPSKKDCAWTTRIAECLHEVQSDYVLLILDDFFLYDFVDTKAFNNCLNWMKDNPKIASFIFYPIYGKTEECNYDGFKRLRKDSIYTICAAILGLWRKDSLLKYTEGYSEDIWLWEKNASNRSRTKYKKDEIYITKDLNNNIFPYDFSKYGLFSGQWQKDTVDLFEKLHINVDFKQRGIYDESLRGRTNSIISSFSFDSAIIPNFNLNHKGSSYIKCPITSKSKNFKQVYKIKGASDIIRWEPSTQWGYGIKNLNIQIIYENKEIENINNENLFGSFIKYNDIFVFNNSVPYMYIPTKKDKMISQLKINGELIFPLDESILKKAYLQETQPKCDDYKYLAIKLFNEFLLSEEKTYYIDANPKLLCVDKNGNEKEMKCLAKYKNNKFEQRFIIDSDYIKGIYSYGDKNGFVLKNVKIKVLLNNGKCYKIKKEQINGIIIYKNYYIFIDRTQLNFDFVNGIKEIIITGKLLCPISGKLLKKIMYEE